jgi:molybdate transport system substrate-binding protein
MNGPALATTLFGLAMALAPSAAGAAELKVLAGGGMTVPLKEIGAAFERASGHKVEFDFAGTPELIKLATSGQPFDLAVVPVDVFKNADAKAKFVAGPTTDIARVGFGVAVKAGAPKPDIGSPDKLKQALLNAQSVALLPESAAGAYVMNVFARLGIAEAMKAKIKPQTTTGAIPAAVAKGDAELGVFLTNVLTAPGVDLVGPFPGDLQSELVFTSAVAAESKNDSAAKALLDYLKTPEATAVLKAKGMTPG